MVDISIGVDANFQRVISSAKSTSAQIRQEMASIDRQARALIAKGVPAAQVQSAVATARGALQSGLTSASAGLPAARSRQRQVDFDRIADRTFPKLIGYLRGLEEATASQAKTARDAASAATAAERQAKGARSRKAAADERAARAAETQARAAEQQSAQATRSMKDLLAEQRAEAARRSARREAARESRQRRTADIQRLAGEEGIPFDEARGAVRQGEVLLRELRQRGRAAAQQQLAETLNFLEEAFEIIPGGKGGVGRTGKEGAADRLRRRSIVPVYWDDEDTRMALGLGAPTDADRQARTAAERRARLRVPEHLREFFALVDRPSNTGQIGVDPFRDVPKSGPDLLLQRFLESRFASQATGENPQQKVLELLRRSIDDLVRLRDQARGRGLQYPTEGDPFAEAVVSADRYGERSPYALGKAVRDAMREVEPDVIGDVAERRSQEARAGSAEARRLQKLAADEARAAQAAVAPYTTPNGRAEELAAAARAAARDARTRRGGDPESDRAAQRRRAAEQEAAAMRALEEEIEDVAGRLRRFGVTVDDVLAGAGGAGGRGGPPPAAGGPPDGPDDPFERLRRILEALQARLAQSAASGQVPTEAIIRELGDVADNPAGFLAEQRRREQYFNAQRELQRMGEANVFDLRALEEGISRRNGLLFGTAYEREFRRRDQAGLTGPDANRLFAGGDFGANFLQSIGVDPESDLGLRTLKDILVREREAREEIVDLLTRQANVEEREQKAYQNALRRLTNATQEAADQRAARDLRDTDTGRSLADIEADVRAERERERAQASIDDIDARRRLGVNEVVNQQQFAARLEAQQNRLVLAQRLEANQDYIRAQAATVASERRLQQAINQQAQQFLLNDPGVAGTGTRFQRLQASLSARTGGSPRLASEYQGFGQFLQSRFLTTAGFALSGAATYFLQAQIREIIREATALQTEFRIIQGVLNSVGQTGREAFGEVRRGILAVSKDTATSADVVARVQRQLAGAFADPETLQPDFTRARTESRAAFQLARVAGLPEQEITDSLTAVSLAFEQSGVKVAFEEVGDLIIGLANRFGVVETEIVRFTADLAPLAAELGFTAQEISTIGAAAQQASGQAGGALAEQFRRILPGLQQRATEVVALFERAGSAGELGEAFGANDLSRVLRILLRDYDELSRAQQNQLATLVGGRREAGAFFALLNRGDSVLRSLDGGTEQFAGSLEDRFSQVSQSVQFAFDKLERAVEELGIALFEAGLADALVGIADAGRVFVSVFGGVLEIFGALNDELGGLPAKVVGLAIAFETLRRAGGFALSIGRNIRGASPNAAPAGGPAGFAALTNALVGLNAVTVPAVNRSGLNASQLQALQRTAAQNAAGARFGGFLRSPMVAAGGIAAGGFALSALTRNNRALSGGIGGAATGAALGSMLGPLGTLVGGGVGLVSGLVSGLNADRAEQQVGRERARNAEVYRYALARIRTENATARRLLEALNSDEGLSEEDQAALDDLVAEQVALGNRSFVRATQTSADRVAERAEREIARRRLSFQEAVTQYEAGAGSQDDVLAAFAAELEAINSQIEGAEAAGNDPTDLLLQRLDVERQRAQFLAEAINRRFDLLDQTAEAFGGSGAGPEADLSRAQARLSALQSAGADPRAIQEAAFAVLAAQRAILDAQISATEDTAEQIAIAQRGMAADANAASVIAEAQMRELLGSGVLERLNEQLARLAAIAVPAGGNGITSALDRAPGAFRDGINNLEELGLSDSDVDAIISAVLATGEAETDAVRAIRRGLKQQMANIRRLIAIGQQSKWGEAYQDVLQALRELDGVLDQLETIAPTDRIQGDTTSRSGGGGSADDLAQRVAEARIAVERARANGDPVRLAQLAIESANIQIRFAKDEAERLQGMAALIEAQNQLQDAYNDIQQARLDLARASSNDPVAQAALDVQSAQLAVAQAKGEAERLRALAQRVEADRAYRDAIRDVVDSRVELAMALATAAGEDVEAAQLALQLAQNSLQRAIQEGDGEAAVNRAQQQVIEAQAGVRDARLASERAGIEFALDMGRATVSQAIAQLQALLQIPGLTEEQTRDILLRIKQLQDQLGQDMQFNLPSDLRLPTLYEARRMVESTRSGTNYQAAQVQNNDNRVITISLEANDPAALDQAIDTIVAAVNAPPRGGNYAPLY